MARLKLVTPAPDGTAGNGFPATGGSYVADEAAGLQQVEGVAESAPAARRGFGALEDESAVAPATTTAPEA